MTTIDTPVLARRNAASPRRRALARLFLGEREDAPWLRPALWVLLVLTAVLYLWNLSASGYANTFYAAAVQAGTQSLKAWFFGSLDSSNFITVDKPPASLWVMVLSARIFGFSSTSLLAPQALMAVASVALVWGTVRRTLARLGSTAANLGGLLAGFVVAFTPAAALMFRFDNPDALLVLLMTAGAYATVRALPRGSWRWIALAGVALGFAFLTKMLQGLLVLPAFGLVYLVAAQASWRKRLVGLVIATGSLVASAGWWVLAVALWPADARPYIGGSTNNTVLDLVFGYNGLGRIFGGSGNGGGGGGTSGSSFGGATGLSRLFSSEMGLEISWLLPAALLAIVLGLIVAGRRPLADPARAGIALWGGWLVVTGLVFSFMSGTIHPYYTVALVPAIAGLIGTAGAMLWAARARILGRAGLAALIAVTVVWGWTLLGQDTSWLPWLRWTMLVGGLLSAALILVGSIPALRRLIAVGVIAGTLFGLAGTTAYALATATTAHGGSIPNAGPISSGGGMGGGFGGAGGGAPSGTAGPGAGGQPPSGSAPAGGTAPTGTTGTTGGATAGGAPGGTTSSSALTALLTASTATWAAAVDGSQSAAQLELASGAAVMAIGGWSSDPAPTLAQFQAWVAAGKVGYYIASGQGGGGGMGGGTSTASEIATWVAANYTAQTVGGSTVYDLGGTN